MYIRTSVVKKKHKTYQYAQIVESYRRKADGMTMKRVVANLGQRSDNEITNLRAAFEASRKGQRVAVGRVTVPPPPHKPLANLRYLDIAVLLDFWRAWGLDALIRELLPTGEANVAPADVVAVLALHRCVDPGSKLDATRWFPRTALPEILNVAPAAFHNTRLHRVLDRLAAATPALMRRLPSKYIEHKAAFCALFIDTTDAWFTGRGPKLAERARAKDGVIRRMIGIVLLCTPDGYPLRWKVIAGKQAEAPAMLEELCNVARLTWGANVPIVVDRALGRTAYLRVLLEARVLFVTALVRPEFPAYTDDIPHQLVDEAGLEGPESDQLATLSKSIRSAGFEQAADDLFVRDLGIVERTDDPDPLGEPVPLIEPADPGMRAMNLARAIGQAVEAGSAASQAAAGRKLGLTKGLTKKYCRLNRLSEELQLEVLNGTATHVPLHRLTQVAQLPSDQQRAAFDKQLRDRAQGRFRRQRQRTPSRATEVEPAPSVRVRAVAYFNPKLFLDQRSRAHRRVQHVQDFVDNLNTTLQSPRSRRSHTSTAAAVDRELRKWNLVDVYKVKVVKRVGDGRARHQVVLELREQEWARRRRFYGFSLLVTHPDLSMDPIDLCQLYRSKDMVEKDFQVIKSTIDLQPIWHHNDAKVRAHVTICMLSLLLERSLRKALGDLMSATAALDALQDCRLNRYKAPSSQAAYLLTHTDNQQDEILQKLGLQHLADDAQMMEAIHPR